MKKKVTVRRFVTEEVEVEVEVPEGGNLHWIAAEYVEAHNSDLKWNLVDEDYEVIDYSEESTEDGSL